QQTTPALRLASNLAGYRRVRGFLSEARRSLEEMLARAPSDTSPARTRALYGLSTICLKQGAAKEAQDFAGRALGAARELNDALGIATALNILGLVALEGSDYVRARGLFEACQAVSKEIGEAAGRTT